MAVGTAADPVLAALWQEYKAKPTAQEGAVLRHDAPGRSTRGRSRERCHS